MLDHPCGTCFDQSFCAAPWNLTALGTVPAVVHLQASHAFVRPALVKVLPITICEVVTLLVLTCCRNCELPVLAASPLFAN